MRTSWKLLLIADRNTQLNSQQQSNPLIDGLRMQVKWLTFGIDINSFTKYNLVRPLVHWYNSRRMNNYITRKIHSRFAEIQSEGSNKSIMDLVLTAYLLENVERKTHNLDATFKEFTMSQIKLFLFSGHDTTSSSVCYIFYVLASYPTVLARVRAEHISVIDSDKSDVASVISSDPFLLNKLHYIVAVIKEVMRIFPAVLGTRAGEPNFNVIDDAGRHFPTDGFLVWDNPQAIHRDPRYWQRPDNFISERWLVTSDDPLSLKPSIWQLSRFIEIFI